MSCTWVYIICIYNQTIHISDLLSGIKVEKSNKATDTMNGTILVHATNQTQRLSTRWKTNTPPSRLLMQLHYKVDPSSLIKLPYEIVTTNNRQASPHVSYIHIRTLRYTHKITCIPLRNTIHKTIAYISTAVSSAAPRLP